MEFQMAEVARMLGVSRQMLHDNLPYLTHRRSGRIVFMDPEVIKSELRQISPKYAKQVFLEEKRPTMDQTAAEWMARVGSDKPCFVQNVFPGDSFVDEAHRANSALLVRKGLLMAEDDDGVTLGPFTFDPKKKYYNRF